MSCHHCNMMADYYMARSSQEERAEMYSAGYATELKEFYETQEERITFKAWLIGQRR